MPRNMPPPTDPNPNTPMRLPCAIQSLPVMAMTKRPQGKKITCNNRFNVTNTSATIAQETETYPHAINTKMEKINANPMTFIRLSAASHWLVCIPTQVRDDPSSHGSESCCVSNNPRTAEANTRCPRASHMVRSCCKFGSGVVWFRAGAGPGQGSGSGSESGLEFCIGMTWGAQGSAVIWS